jgi:hypothetical protein
MVRFHCSLFIVIASSYHLPVPEHIQYFDHYTIVDLTDLATEISVTLGMSFGNKGFSFLAGPQGHPIGK